MRRSFSRRGVLIGICITWGIGAVFGQTHSVGIFSSDQEYYRTFKDLPQADQLEPDFVLLSAHVNRGLGAQFNQITSLTTIYCRKKTAISAMEKSISQLLVSELHFNIRSDWDPSYGTLKASLLGWSLIDSSPPEFQQINLKMQVNQTKSDYRGFILDYEILSSPQQSSKSWPDVSMTPAARTYIDDLCVKIRHSIEQSLKDQCEKATVRDIRTEEEALQLISQRLKLKPADVKAVRDALENQDE
jgi:hypothetical protein